MLDILTNRKPNADPTEKKENATNCYGLSGSEMLDRMGSY